jgi:arginyl-tRNA synthetase
LLATSKGKKKMSTRKGELVLLEDFMNEAVKKAALEIRKRKTKGDAEAIGLAAVKYAILKTEENKNVVFSWQEALNFEGDTGPYLQYAYARASSILRKAKLSKKQIKVDFSILKNEKEISLIKMLSEFPEICKNAAEHLTPHVIAGYVYKLAKSFNDFYEACPVLNAEQKEKEARLLLVIAARQVLGNALSLLGIKALGRM